MTRLRRPPRSCAILVGIVLALAGVTRPPDASAGPPTDALKDFFAAVNVVLNDSRTADQPMEKLRAIRRHVDEMVDFREAAMLALGREWHARTPLEQNEFVALFADLLERSFVWRVAGKASLGAGVRVDYLGETLTGDAASVDTAIAGRDGNDFRLEFRMVRRGERWVVRDIVLDGVSSMENYHAQFQRMVRDASWRELIVQLRAKVGAPAGGVQVAAAAPVPTPAPAPPATVAVPLRPLDVQLDRPGTDLPHAIARHVAAAPPAPLETAAAPRHTTAPGQTTPPAPATSLAPSREVDANVEGTPRLPALATAPVEPAAPVREARSPVPVASILREPASVRVVATPARALDSARVVSAPRTLAAAMPAPRTIEPRRALEPPRALEPRRAVEAPRPAPATAAPDVWIQVGAFRSAATAGRVAEQVQGEILVAPPAAGAGREPLLRVRVGPFPDRARAADRLREIRALGYRPFLAVGD